MSENETLRAYRDFYKYALSFKKDYEQLDEALCKTISTCMSEGETMQIGWMTAKIGPGIGGFVKNMRGNVYERVKVVLNQIEWAYQRLSTVVGENDEPLERRGEDASFRDVRNMMAEGARNRLGDMAAAAELCKKLREVIDEQYYKLVCRAGDLRDYFSAAKSSLEKSTATPIGNAIEELNSAVTQQKNEIGTVIDTLNAMEQLMRQQ